MKVWLLLLPLFFNPLFGRKSSERILRMLKEEYPERRIEHIKKGDFKSWFIIGGREGASFNFRYGWINDGQDYSWFAVPVDGYFIVGDHPLMFFFDRGEKSARYNGVMYEVANDRDLKIWTMKGKRCQGHIPGWQDDLKYRAQTYIVNGYLSYNPTDVVDLRPLAKQCIDNGGNAKLTLNGFNIKQADSSRITTQMAVLHDSHCWKQTEKKCVDDQEMAGTASVARKNAILHVDNLTVYGHCAYGDGARCTYFIYDHLSNIDFYIPDSLAKEMFNTNDVAFLVPSIEANDTFVKTRRNQFTTTTGASTTTTTTTTTLKPIDVATAPTRPPPVDPPIEDEAPIDEGPDDYEDDQFEADQQNPSSRSSQAFIIAIIFGWLTI